MKAKFSLRAKMLTYMLITTSIVLIASVAYIGDMLKKNSITSKKDLVFSIAKAKANQINADMNIEIDIALNLANSISSFGQLPKEEMLNTFNGLMRSTLIQNEYYYSTWISWENDYLDDSWNKPYGREMYVFFREGGKVKYYSEILDTIDEDIKSKYYQVKLLGKEIIFNPELYSYSGLEEDEVFMTSVAVPIKDNGKFVGVIGIDISFDKFQDLAIETKELGISFNTILLSNNGIIAKHPKKYLINREVTEIFDIEMEKEHQIYDKIKRGKANNIDYIDNTTNETIFYRFEPLVVGNSKTPWSLLIEVPFDKYFKEANSKLWYALLFGLGGLFIVSLVVWIFSRNITLPLAKTTEILKALALGDINDSYKLKIDSNDEIGEMTESVNSVIDGLNLTASFAKEIGKGNLTAEFNKLSDRDVLGESLIEMKESLQDAKSEEEKRKVEDAKQNWATQGLAKFGDILRESTDNMEDLTYNILSNLVKYVEGNQGGLFVINEDDNQEKYIDLIACYAYERKKYLNKKMAYNEGLVGRCVQEKETIYMTEIPKDYINISSGLGQDTPRCLLIVPLILNEEVYGVIEIASFKKFEPHIVAFVEKIGQSIASTISNVKINLRTAELLEESRIQAEELAAQEEEMRQNLEELQATQEESARKEAEMSGMLAAMNASLLVAECDIEGYIISVNNDFSRTYGIDKASLIGKSYKEIAVECGIIAEQVEKTWNSLKAGEIVKNTTQLNVNEKDKWINQTYAPILNNEGKPYKVLNIGIDISEIKEKEEEIKNHQETLIAILDQIDGKIFLKDQNGVILLCNSEVAKAYNKTVEELMGTSDFDNHEKELAQEYFNREQEIIKNGAQTYIQEENLTGSLRYLKTTKMPFFIPYLNQTGLLGIQMDVTDIKTMQIEIEKQNKDLLAIQKEMTKEKALMDCMMEYVPDNIYFKDIESRFLRVSKNMLKLFRATDYNEVYGKTDFDFFTIEHAQQAYDDEQNIIKTGKPIIGQIEKETFDDGTESWADTTKMPLVDKQGDVIGTFGISRDVTEIKKMEVEAKAQAKLLEQSDEELRQNIEELKTTQDELMEKQEMLMWESSMFNTLMNHLPDRISFKDKEGKFRRVNKTKAMKHGISNPLEIIGKSDHDFFTKEHADKALQEEQELLRNGKPILNIEEKLTWKDGTITWGSTSRIPFANNEGVVIGSLVMTKDTTPIKLAHAEIINSHAIIDGLTANTPVLVYKTEPNGLIIEMKGAGLKWMGKDENKLIGKKMESAFPEAKKDLAKGIEGEVKFAVKGKFENKPWEMEHYLYPDQTTDGGIIGYAFLKGLV